ncbi:hypothetical protein BH09ACT5_BH09ACT5_17080 [soil metagenome]
MRAALSRLTGSKLVRFFVVAVAGVLLDVTVFSLLVGLGARPAVASLVSTSIAVCATYAASSRAVFRVRLTAGRLAAYLAWYAVSITAFAFAIDAAFAAFGGSATLWKIASLPVSFLVNFTVVNYVILRPEKEQQ